MLSPDFAWMPPEWATTIAVMPMIFTALAAAIATYAVPTLITSSIIGGATALGKSIHHAVKTGEMWWDNPEAYLGHAVGGIPYLGQLLEQGVYEVFPEGIEANWEGAGIGTGINIGTSAVGAYLGGDAGGVVDLATETGAPETATNVITETATPVAIDSSGSALVETAKEASGLSAALRPAAEGTGYAAQVPAGTGAHATPTQQLASATTRAEMKEALGQLGDAGVVSAPSAAPIAQGVQGATQSPFANIWDQVKGSSTWIGENIARPVRQVAHSVDNIPYVGPVLGSAGRSAAVGAVTDPENRWRGAAGGAVGGLTSSAIGSAIQGVAPTRIDVRDHVDTQTFGERLGTDALSTLVGTASTVPAQYASLATQEALTPSLVRENPLLPKSLEEVGPLQRMRTYGGTNPFGSNPYGTRRSGMSPLGATPFTNDFSRKRYI